MTSKRHECSYCGLVFTGEGYSPDKEHHYCCYGCCLVERIMGAKGGEGIASWMLVRLGIGAFLSMNVMMISLVLYVSTEAELGRAAVLALRWGMQVLSTPAVVILGSPFLLGAVRAIRRRELTTDALIATGSFAAYGVSAMHTIQGSGHVYFDTATMLLVIVTLGRLLEATAKNRTSQAIKNLMELTPDTARILRDGIEIEVSSDEITTGDLMIVRPGERLAADGRIIAGECMVEEAAFTGESMPRPCAPGDAVFGGSINCDGLIKVEVTSVGGDSLLSRIQEMVRQSQHDRAPVERLTERVASVFVPVIWATAFGAAAYWGLLHGEGERAGLSALAVLVVACPCALGLSTPMATCLAIGKAARAGVLIRSGEILERLSSIKQVYFDKTGTLTASDLTVSEIKVLDDSVSEEEALAAAAAVESGSEHAIAKAVLKAARASSIEISPVDDFRVFPGRGVSGVVTLNGSEKVVTAGSLSLLSESSLITDTSPLTTVYVGWDGAARAAIVLQDNVRDEARNTVESLSSSGVAVTIISGDQDGPTRRLAESVGITNVLSECSPEKKAAAIRTARLSGVGPVAMVGDGINDAPALAESDVGIAVGGGTDLARQASDVTLLGDDLSRIPWALELSRRTYSIIRQNLWWAFGYNSVAVVLAFFGYVHPLIAAAAMVASSLAVIANSLRLTRDS